jgi:hypothetical protein
MPRSRESAFDTDAPTPELDAPEPAAAEHDDDRPSQADIAREAYLIYLAHGAEEGHDQEHWFEAERRLVSGRDAAPR